MEIAHAAQCHVQCHFILSRWKQCLVWFPRVPCSDVTFQGFAITSFRRSSTPINSGEPSNFVGQRDYSIHRNVYIYSLLLTRVDYFSSSLCDTTSNINWSFLFFVHDPFIVTFLSLSPFLYFRSNIRGAIYLSTRSLKISPRGEIVVTRHTFPLRLTTSVSNRFDPFPLPLMLLLLSARSIIFV